MSMVAIETEEMKATAPDQTEVCFVCGSRSAPFLVSSNEYAPLGVCAEHLRECEDMTREIQVYFAMAERTGKGVRLN